MNSSTARQLADPPFLAGLHPVWMLIALGASFFGSLMLATAFFPVRYDWRHTVISSLVSPRNNPHAFWIAGAGLALSGILLIPFCFFLEKRLRPVAPRLAFWAGSFLLLGALCLTLSGVVVPGHYRILGIGRSHEHLAQVASVAFCLSLILYLGAILRLRSSPFPLRPLAGVLVILPVTALIVSRLSLFCAHAFSSPPVYQAVKASLWSSLALWEWVGSACIYLFLALITLAPLSRTPRGK